MRQAIGVIKQALIPRPNRRQVIVGLRIFVALAAVTAVIILFGGFNFSSSNAPLISALLALVGVLIAQIVNTNIARSMQVNQQGIEAQRAQAQALRDYLEQMGKLLIDQHLRTSQSTAEVRTLARSQTLAVLEGMDSNRRQILLQFLYESKLINTEQPVVSLIGANLKGTYLKGFDLRSINLSGADLSGANLSDAYLRSAHFRDTILRKADLKGTRLNDARLRNAVLRGATLSGAELSNAYLRGTDLRGADLRGVHSSSGANLSDADLRGANLGDAKLRGTSFRGANLREASLRGTDLSDAYLGNAYLKDADLSGAKLIGAEITDEQLTSCASLKDIIGPDRKGHD